jgi:AcrR family transcriptional regulator
METIRGRRGGYHHGDLRNALVRAATELASSGGPEAVVLRAAARRVGVTPTAAYRHFSGQGDLLEVVKEYGQEQLAHSMDAAVAEHEAAAAASVSPVDPGEAAVLRFRAVGRGYLRFAFAEPGLYRTAFCRVQMPAHPETGHPTSGGTDDFRSFQMLSTMLDGLVAAGRMPAARRPGAEIFAWSAVHGLALLVIDGPLSRLHGPALDDAVETLLVSVSAGLST